MGRRDERRSKSGKSSRRLQKTTETRTTIKIGESGIFAEQVTSSSEDSNYSESELETDLDVDICSDSADESSGLDVSDENLHQEIREGGTKQRKIRSERRLKLKIVRQSETESQRNIRIVRRNRRRLKRRQLRIARKGQSISKWRARINKRLTRRTWIKRWSNESEEQWKKGIERNKVMKRNKRLRR